MRRCGFHARGVGGGGARLAAVLGLTLSVALTACAQPHGPSPHEQPARVSIEVDNQDFHDVVMYTLISGMRTRLGTVTGEGTGHFSIPWSPGDVGMEIHVIGGSTYDTDTLPVHPGDRLKVVVMPGVQPRVSLTGHH